LKLQKPSRPAASLRQRKANELKTKRKASRRLLVQFVGGVKISELQTNLSFIRKIIYAHNNASLPLLLPRLSDNSIAVAHHSTRLGLTDEARLGAVVVVVRHNRMGQQKDIGQQQEYYGHRAFHITPS
jgi:hypothetical protein